MEKQFDNIYLKRFLYFNVYVIKGNNGDILIDTGFIGTRKRLKKWLDNFNIKLIILTHAHVDHTWNVSYLKELYNCEVAIGEKDLDNIDNTKIVTQPLNNKFKVWTKLMSTGMKLFKPKPFKIDHLLKDNEILNKYGLNLKIIPLSGHTTGSIGIKYKDKLFAGDALVNRGDKASLAFQNQDNEKALSSLSNILKEQPKIIFVGHDHEITKEKLNYSFKNNTEK